MKFALAARTHRIGRQHVRYVMATAVPTTITATSGAEGWLWIGRDDPNVELTVIAIEARYKGDQVLLVIHAQPTYERK